MTEPPPGHVHSAQPVNKCAIVFFQAENSVNPRRVLFFSMADLVDAWRAAAAADTSEGAIAFDDGELEIVTLDELVGQMRAPRAAADGDHRETIFVPNKKALVAVGRAGPQSKPGGVPGEGTGGSAPAPA